jgi:16S rRNA (cytidine1402-2'-O)-methyltransferase
LERWGPEEARGEFTIVVGPGSGPDVSVADGAEEARRLVGEGLSMSAAAREVATSTGLPRREIYAALLADQERN